jgi:salicylate hydroxylase
MSHLSNRSQIGQFLEAYHDLRYSRVQQVSQSELNNAGLTMMPPGEHRDARDAALGMSLVNAGNAPTEWNDEDLRKQWEDIAYAFGYDAGAAAEDWWLGFGRIAARAQEIKGEYEEESRRDSVSMFSKMRVRVQVH